MDNPPSVVEKDLKHLMVIKERETVEVVELHCLFCKSELGRGKRQILFEHLWNVHHFFFGHPNNLIFIDRFLEMLRKRLHEEHKCLKCEKKFADYNKCRLHMRKKGHFGIPSKCKEYDQFYLSNYVKKSNSDEEEDEDDAAEGEQEENWDDWVDESKSNNVLCLLCSNTFPTSSLVIDHLRTHDFDLLGLIHEMKLDFFGRIKLINYIRRKVADDANFDVKNVKKEDFHDVQNLFCFIEDDEMLTHEFEVNFDKEEEERIAVESALNDENVVKQVEEMQNVMEKLI